MIEFGIKDIVDILLVALLLYYTYRLMRESRSLNVFVGLMIFIVVWVFVSHILEMKLLGSILDKLVSVGVIVVVVIFQEDIRKVLYNLGTRRRIRTLIRFFSPKRTEERDMARVKKSIMPMVQQAMTIAAAVVSFSCHDVCSSPMTMSVSTQ